MAQGLQNTYPKHHLKYRHLIENQGGVVTDFWSTATMEPSNFIKRNRLIAGLSEATVIIESAEKGGSLATAEIAFGYNREVFALPGRTTDIQSQGCNNLIKIKSAHLVSTSRRHSLYLKLVVGNPKKSGAKKVVCRTRFRRENYLQLLKKRRHFCLGYYSDRMRNAHL